MRLAPLSKSRLLRRSTALSNALASIHANRRYHWGNYDVTPGQCCKMQDEETRKCFQKKLKCKLTSLPNSCYKFEDNATVTHAEYPKQLLSVIRPPDPECDLIKHDVCYYVPSDKSRQFQRTWPECPLIWLRPKHICCPDEEYYPMLKRRKRPPPQPMLTMAEKHAFQMKLLCKANRLGMPIKQKCIGESKVSDCTKVPTPFPSFSECDQKCIQRYCPTECACKFKPSLCEMWRMHHRNGILIKRCTQALVGYCPFKRRARPLY